jgi:hypothetical protein
MKHGAMVMLDVDGVCVCPLHGPQPQAEYAPGQAPCGCVWRFDSHGVLRSLPGETVVLQREVPQVDVTSHKGL